MKKLLSALLAIALCASFAALAEAAPVGDKVRVGISWVADFGDGAPDENIQAYMNAVTKAGGEPVYLSQVTDEASAEEALSDVDCAILTGGEDIGPAYYGEEPVEELGEVNDARDVSRLLAGEGRAGRQSAAAVHLPGHADGERRLRRHAVPGHSEPV